MTDTTPEADAIQTSILQRLTGVARLQLALEMSCLARELSAARLRREHPDWTGSHVNRELLRYAFGSVPWPPPIC